jgi:hypothetical protein
MPTLFFVRWIHDAELKPQEKLHFGSRKQQKAILSLLARLLRQITRTTVPAPFSFSLSALSLPMHFIGEYLHCHLCIPIGKSNQFSRHLHTLSLGLATTT